MPLPRKEERDARAQEILRLALAEIRSLGLAPIFRWGKNELGHPNGMAVHISDFHGFHELPN